MKTFYAASLSATRHDQKDYEDENVLTVEMAHWMYHTAALIEASSNEEAEQKALRECKDKFPYKFGYRHHNAVVLDKPLHMEEE